MINSIYISKNFQGKNKFLPQNRFLFSAFSATKKTQKTPPRAGVGIRNISDYSPFGVLLKERTVESAFYRRGFQDLEGDSEVSGKGNSYTTDYRQYDTRIARWKSLDLLMAKYPDLSPYAAFNNNPIYYIDPFGLEGVNSDVSPDTKTEISTEPAIAPPASSIGFKQIETLLNPKSTLEEKIQIYKDMKTASFKMNATELESEINNSTNSFIKSNKTELLKINSLALEDGVLQITLDKGTDEIELEGKNREGKDQSLYLQSTSSIDVNGLNAYKKSFEGPRNESSKEIVKRTAWQASGKIKLSGMYTDGLISQIKINHISFKTETLIKSNDNGIRYKTLKVTSYINVQTYGDQNNGTIEDKITW